MNQHLQQPSPSDRAPRPWQPRFGLGAMLLIMLVASVMAAAASYLVRGLRGDRSFQLVFLLITLSAPLLLVVAVSLLRQLIGWLSRDRRN